MCRAYRFQQLPILPLFIISFCLLLSAKSYAWVPPENSPLAIGDHPRILIISEKYKTNNPEAFGITISEIRERAISNSLYKSYIQNIITDVDTKGFGVSLIGTTYPRLLTNYAIEMAFLYLLDPKTIPGLSALHDANEYADEAIRIALHIADKMDDYTDIAPVGGEGGSKENWLDLYIYDYGSGDWTGPKNLSIAIVNDWCNPRISSTEKEKLLDGIINSFNKRYPEELDTMADHKFYGSILNNGLGVIGFYGDTDINVDYIREIENIMTTVIGDYWMDGFFTLHNKVFDGTKTLQGTDYDMGALKECSLGLIALATSLNENYYEKTPMLRDQVYFYTHLINPRPLTNGTTRWIPYADTASNMEDADLEYGREYRVTNPIIYALSNSNVYKDRAILMKWARDQSPMIGRNGTYETPTRELIYRVLYSDEFSDLPVQSPDLLDVPKSVKMGNGVFVLRTGLTNKDDTAIFFQANSWEPNHMGHALPEYGSFKIFKYGDLTTSRHSHKGGFDGYSWFGHTFNNVMGVYKPGEEYYGFNWMGYRMGGFEKETLDSSAPAWQTNGGNYVGTVIASDINNTNYDYIDYRYDQAWDQSKVDYSERELIYLKSAGGINDEYVIIYDRLNTTDQSYSKFYLLQVPFEAKLLDNSGNEITMTPYTSGNFSDGGKWQHTGSSPTSNNTIELINNWADNASHGKLFNKTLAPESFIINKTGGPGHYVEDAEGNKVSSIDNLTDTMKNYIGSYTFQIESKTQLQYDTFLNVMQIGDSNTLETMTETVKINATGMEGAHIKDATQNRVILFSNAKAAPVTEPTAYNVTTTAPTTHVLCGMKPETQYLFNINNVTSSFTSNNAGIITFNTQPGQISVSIDGGSPITQPATIEINKLLVDD